MKMEKIKSKNTKRDLRNRSANKTTVHVAQAAQKKQRCFYCWILISLHISLIFSIPLSFDQVYIKHKQPQVVSPDSRATIDTIHQTQDSTTLLWVWRHYSRHAAWPTVIVIFMETRWKNLALSTRNLI